MNPTRWLEMLGALRAEQTPCVVVVVADVKGSAPREVGARMVVAKDRPPSGTIGGGRLEQLAIERANELLDDPHGQSESMDVTLSEQAGQCCGGAVKLFLDPYRWSERRVVIFGAGHVGQAIGGLAPYLNAKVRLVDGRHREELHPHPVENPDYELDLVDAPEGVVDELTSDDAVLILTHDHALDLLILERALRRGPFRYLGMIGSDRKWSRFQKRLLSKGFTTEDIATVRCPIGVTRTSKDPAAIALSVAAELSQVFELTPHP